jgi:hypothetical protein
MSSIATRRHINTYVEILKGRYQEPSVVITKIPNKKNDHFVRPNMVVLSTLTSKKNVDLHVHVKIFNFAMKANVETLEEYIINAFSYTLKDITLD